MTHRRAVSTVAAACLALLLGTLSAADPTAEIGTPVADVAAPNGQTFLAQVLPSGNGFVTLGGDRVTRLFDREGRLVRAFKRPELAQALTQLAVSRDGSRLATGGFDGLISVWETETGTLLASARQSAGVRSISFTADGRTLVTGSWDAVTRVWDAGTIGDGTLPELNRTPARPLPVIADVSPDGSLIATATGDWKQWREDGELRLWDGRDLAEVAVLVGHRAELKGVRFSADGATLLSFGSDATARLWDVKTQQELAVFRHPDAVTAATFLPNTNIVVTGDVRGVIRFWENEDVAIGVSPRDSADPTRSFRAHEKLVYRIDPTPDGTALLTNSPDLRLKLWRSGHGTLDAAWTFQALAVPSGQ